MAQSLATRALRGVLWTGGSIAVQFAITLAFFKFLPPATMGQFQAALTLVLLLAFLGDLGMGAALVQLRRAEEHHFSAAFWASATCGLLLVALAPFTGPLVARFTEDPIAFERTFSPLAWLIPFAAASGTLRARLQRDLRFRALALVEVAASAAGALVGLGVLLGGGGIWSPILSAVSREVFHMVFLWLRSGWYPRFDCRFADLRQLLGFGLNTTGANVVNYLNNNLDYLFVLYFMGYETLGYYAFAYRCTMQPYSRVATAIARVSFPVFANVQDNSELLRRGYLKTIVSVALAAWPLLCGMLIFGEDIIYWVRPDLMPALAAFQILVLTSLCKTVGTVVGSIYLAKGKAHWAFRFTLFSLAALLPGLYWGASYGPAGIAAALCGLSVLFLIVSQYLVNRLIDLSFAAYLRALARPLAVALWVLTALAFYRTYAAPEGLGPLVLAGPVAAVAYILGLRVLAWDLCREYWNYFRSRS